MTARMFRQLILPLPRLTDPARGPYTQPELPYALSGHCSVLTASGLCPERAIAYVVLSCDHEHLREGLQCSAHVEVIRDGLLCLACRDSADPHECPLSLIEIQHREA